MFFSTGIQNADSIVIDPHKGLFQPHGCGSVLFKNGLPGDGIYEDRLTNPLENKPPFRGFPLWFSLNVYGTDLVKQITSSKVEMAKYIYNVLKKCEYLSMGPKPQLSKVVFRVCGPREESYQPIQQVKPINRSDDKTTQLSRSAGRWNVKIKCNEELRRMLARSVIKDDILYLDIVESEPLTKTRDTNEGNQLSMETINVVDQLSINHARLSKEATNGDATLLQKAIIEDDRLTKEAIDGDATLLQRAIKKDDRLTKEAINGDATLLQRAIIEDDRLTKEAINGDATLLQRAIVEDDRLTKEAIDGDATLLQRAIIEDDRLTKEAINGKATLLQRAIIEDERLTKEAIKGGATLLQRAIIEDDRTHTDFITEGSRLQANKEHCNKLTRQLMQAIEEDGMLSLSTTNLNGFTFIHLCTESLRCQISDIIFFLDVTLSQVTSISFLKTNDSK